MTETGQGCRWDANSAVHHAAPGLTRHALRKAARPRAILDLIHSAEEFRIRDASEGGARAPVAGKCARCGYMSSQPVCKACLLLEGLNRGLPGLGVGRAPRSGSSRKGSSRGEPGSGPGPRAAEVGTVNGVW